MAELLRKAGYDTVHIGKWHLSDLREGPRNKEILSDFGFNYAVSDPYMLAWQVVSLATDWVERLEPGRPFFINLAPFEPHSSAGAYAPTLYRRLYETPEAEAEAKLIPYSGFTRPRASWNLRGQYFGAITQMDDAFGALMEFLEAV